MNTNGVVTDSDNNTDRLEALRRQFFAEEDLLSSRLEQLITKVRQYCTIDKKGNVHVADTVKGARNQVQVALSARAIAARLENQISADVSLEELADATGLATNVVSARCAELAKSRSIESARRGSFRMASNRVERFLDSLNVQ
jgi:hypothetical protein